MKSFLLGSLHLVLLHHFRQHKMLSVYQLLFFSSFVFIKVNNMYIIYHLYHFKCIVPGNKYIVFLFFPTSPTLFSFIVPVLHRSKLLIVVLQLSSYVSEPVFVQVSSMFFSCRLGVGLIPMGGWLEGPENNPDDIGFSQGAPASPSHGLQSL